MLFLTKVLCCHDVTSDGFRGVGTTDSQLDVMLLALSTLYDRPQRLHLWIYGFRSDIYLLQFQYEN